MRTFSPTTQKGPTCAEGSISAEEAQTEVGVDSRRKRRFGEEQREDARKADARIGHADERLGGGVVGAIDENRGGGALLGFVEKCFVFGEGQVARAGGGGGGETRELRGWVSDDLAVELLWRFLRL